MTDRIRIALIGDYLPTVKAHVAIPGALDLAAADLKSKVEPNWIATPLLDGRAGDVLAPFHAIWCVPNSPYASMSGALNGIRFARESGRPFLGTCGGFQHALIEYARNVLGVAEADHAESNPDTTVPLVSALSCSLSGARGRIRLNPQSRLAAIYARAEIQESYNCNFGFNPKYESLLANSKIAISGRDPDGNVRALELADHPFFIATLFQPELSGSTGAAHPLIRAFVQATVH
jgi:CTP synthase (UTP-ammonia lyase)